MLLRPAPSDVQVPYMSWAIPRGRSRRWVPNKIGNNHSLSMWHMVTCDDELCSWKRLGSPPASSGWWPHRTAAAFYFYALVPPGGLCGKMRKRDLWKIPAFPLGLFAESSGFLGWLYPVFRRLAPIQIACPCVVEELSHALPKVRAIPGWCCIPGKWWNKEFRVSLLLPQTRSLSLTHKNPG